MKHTLNLQKIASLLIIICILVYFLLIAKSLLMPFVFALLFTFLLKPICEKIERLIPIPAFAVLLSFLIVLIPLFIILGLFSVQTASVFGELPAIGEKLKNGFNDSFLWVNQKLGLTNLSGEKWIKENVSDIIRAPIEFIGQSISSSSVFLANLFLFFIYTFFLLLYRSSIKQFLLIQTNEKRRANTEKLFEKIQTVVQEYLSGMGIVMLLLGVLNSLGLYLIGIEHALLWGFLAAFLAIIPYIGTFVGGLLPFIYALTTTGSLIKPLLIVLLFGIVQSLEGNIITPKIVGSSVKINPLAAIISLIVGATLWGIAGAILALPVIAIVRIIMNQIDYLKPVSVLLSSDIYEKENVFEEKFDKEKFRFWKIF